MSKSYLSTLSLIMSFIVGICTIFIVPDVLESLGFESLKLFLSGLFENLGELNVIIFAAFLFIFALNLILKCFTVTFCKKLLNSFVFLFDIAFIALCVLLLLTNASLSLLIATAGTLFAIIFDFVFFYAEM